MEILIMFLVVLFVTILSANLVLFIDGSHKYLGKVYKELPSKKYYLNVDQVYDMPYVSSGINKNEFIWFTDTNEFKVNDGHYLHNQIYTYLSPYHYYWLKKYQRWFKENVDLKTIEKF